MTIFFLVIFLFIAFFDMKQLIKTANFRDFKIYCIICIFCILGFGILLTGRNLPNPLLLVQYLYEEILHLSY